MRVSVCQKEWYIYMGFYICNFIDFRKTGIKHGLTYELEYINILECFFQLMFLLQLKPEQSGSMSDDQPILDDLDTKLPVSNKYSVLTNMEPTLPMDEVQRSALKASMRAIVPPGVIL